MYYFSWRLKVGISKVLPHGDFRPTANDIALLKLGNSSHVMFFANKRLQAVLLLHFSTFVLSHYATWLEFAIQFQIMQFQSDMRLCVLYMTRCHRINTESGSESSTRKNFLSPSGDLGIRLVWHNLSPDQTGPDPHFGPTVEILFKVN